MASRGKKKKKGANGDLHQKIYEAIVLDKRAESLNG